VGRLDVTAFRWPLLLVTLAWAIVLSAHPGLFDTSPFALLANVAPAPAWAMAMFGIGSVLLAGTLTDSRRVVRVGLMGTTALWTFTSLLFGLTGAPTALTTYGILAGMSAWALVKVGSGDGWR